MSGPQGAGVIIKPFGNPITYTPEVTEDFTSGVGTWDWNIFASSHLGTDLGSVTWTTSAGNLVLSNVNNGTLADNAGSSTNKAWGSLQNKEDLTTGDARNARILINFSRTDDTYAASAAYWGQFGRTTDGYTYVSIGKTWNSSDETYATQYIPLPINAVIRLRHDGNGVLILDVDGVDVLSYVDFVHLRALGWGISGSCNSSSTFAVDNAAVGTWGAISAPSPWYTGDTVDTNQITAGLWTTSGAWPQRELTRPSYQSRSGTSTGWRQWLTSTASLSADQFIEATLATDGSVLDCFVNLRCNTTLTTGYYARWTSDGGNKWEIGKNGVGSLANFSASSPGSPYRLRFEAQGTALRLYEWTGGAWVLRVSTTDATYTTAGNPCLYYNDVFNQGTPFFHDVVVGSILSSVDCTVERKSYDSTTDTSIYFEVIFNQPVTGFASGDCTVTGTASANTSVEVTGSGRKYLVRVYGMGTTGTIQLDVASSVCTAVTHGASNNHSVSFDNTVTFTGTVSPISILGVRCLAWWDGTDVSAASMTFGVADAIVVWKDKTTNARNLDKANTVAPTSQTNVINGLPVVDFDPAAASGFVRFSQFMYSNGTIEIWAVSKSDDAVNGTLISEGKSSTAAEVYRLLDLVSTDEHQFSYSDPSNVDRFATAASRGSGSAWRLTIATDYGVAVGTKCEVVGVATATNGAYTRPATTFDRLAIGVCVRNSSSLFFDGKIAEIFVVTSAATTAERGALATYINTKYATSWTPS